MGRRIDVALVIGPVILVLEFKVGEESSPAYAIDQVTDYALDLKNFHETSHSPYIVPILIPTEAKDLTYRIAPTPHGDRLLHPISISPTQLKEAIPKILAFTKGDAVDHATWEQGRYSPTPTIIEAALALYANHSVADITRNDAGSTNLKTTSDAISQVISDSREHGRKSICFVTGVPGAGKTLVGLDVATRHIDKKSALHSVFLSGNGPLVAILREALARDKVSRESLKGIKIKKGEARSEVQMFIQNVHHFRDDCLQDTTKPPVEHVALFDEAQRAWNRDKTVDFMCRKKKVQGFDQSEPEFLAHDGILWVGNSV
ncbi:MAG: DUF2075 domain-containing protein [Elusimicrobia bacterium]|nr:DUF2075 domain-containing protein [Elusimicrobiota bacterium]